MAFELSLQALERDRSWINDLVLEVVLVDRPIVADPIIPGVGGGLKADSLLVVNKLRREECSLHEASGEVALENSEELADAVSVAAEGPVDRQAVGSQKSSRLGSPGE